MPSADDETKTTCPACRGSGKREIVSLGNSRYSYVECDACKGVGMVTATQARAWKNAQKPD